MIRRPIDVLEEFLAHAIEIERATKRDLLLLALRGEAGAQFFFAWVARTTRNAQVRELAREMALDEAQHVRWLEQALGYGATSAVPA